MKKLKFIFIILISIINNFLVKSKLMIQEEADNSLEVINYFNDNNKFLENIEYEQLSSNLSSNNNTNPISENSNIFSLKYISVFTYGHLILSFLILPVLSIYLILIDMSEDKKIKRNIGLPSNMKVKNEYNLIKNTHITSNKYFFSWFLFKYDYPITNIIFVYHFNHPRYLRLTIYLILLLMII